MNIDRRAVLMGLIRCDLSGTSGILYARPRLSETATGELTDFSIFCSNVVDRLGVRAISRAVGDGKGFAARFVGEWIGCLDNPDESERIGSSDNPEIALKRLRS